MYMQVCGQNGAYMYMYLHVYVRSKGGNEEDGDRERESVYLCVYHSMCLRERERDHTCNFSFAHCRFAGRTMTWMEI